MENRNNTGKRNLQIIYHFKNRLLKNFLLRIFKLCTLNKIFLSNFLSFLSPFIKTGGIILKEDIPEMLSLFLHKRSLSVQLTALQNAFFFFSTLAIELLWDTCLVSTQLKWRSVTQSNIRIHDLGFKSLRGSLNSNFLIAPSLFKSHGERTKS